jgi:PAS domain S-box-containing protein
MIQTVEQIDFRLWESTPGYRILFLPDAPTFTIVSASDQLCKTIQTPREKLVGKGVFQAFPQNPDDKDFTAHKNLLASLTHVLEHKTAHTMASQRYDVEINGRFEEIYWQNTSVPFFGSDGELAYIMHTTDNITEKVKSTEMRAVVEQSPAPTLVVRGDDFRIEHVNKAMLEFLDSDTDIITRPMIAILPESEKGEVWTQIQRVYSNGTPFDRKEVAIEHTRNGNKQTYYYDVSYRPLNEGGRITGVIQVALDVTEQVMARKQMEAAQAETEKQKRLYEAVINNTPDLQYIFSLDYRFLFANEALLKMWGATPEEAFGKGLRQLGYEEWHASMHEREIDEIVRTKKPVRGIVAFPHAELGKREYDYLLVPVFNKDFEVEAVAGTTRDITEIQLAASILEEKVKERTTDLEKLNTELKRSNDHLEEFAHAASHDLKEPIRKIAFFTHQLKGQLSSHLEENEARLFNRIENATERMGALIDDLLLYSHVSQRPHAMEEVDLNERVKRVLEDLELDIAEKNAQVFVGAMPKIQGYGRQLQQLLQNLLTNSLKYSQEGVPPVIRIDCSIKEDKAGQFYEIKVADNGIGFDMQYSDKIFQMFARLHGKQEYSGTGVGLSIVKKVVENHNGLVRVESKPGKGSVFTIYLPVNNVAFSNAP